ncbi:uncharacterized protein Spn100A [Drosophila pseudoobscura]|uniref:Uncharacterized protein Spn100A n=1 Tax=Drosophila pseudoobscura pseudoobscura TaxID=46245 RepID=A0A6I8VQ94_DROPS|nr:uncharacterized protein LOC4800270 [Drosophila pseudoobscura]
MEERPPPHCFCHSLLTSLRRSRRRGRCRCCLVLDADSNDSCLAFIKSLWPTFLSFIRAPLARSVSSLRPKMKAVLCVLPLLAALVCSLPTAEKESSSKGASFASATSQLIAMQLLKFNKDIDANQVHSPLGVTSILGVLAEASEGETYAEFTKVFGYPKDRSQLRDVYRRVLGRYQNRDAAVALPSFQTWFYIYRNHSAREEFKELLQQHYFVEVKDINRKDYDWNEPNTSLQLQPEGSGSDASEAGEESLSSTEQSNSKDVIGFETLKRINLDDDLLSVPADTYGEEVLDKEASKLDRDVDDKQYVEKPVAQAEAEQLQREQAAATTTTEAEAEATTPEAEAAAEAAAEAVEKQEKPAIAAAGENPVEKQQNKRSDNEENQSQNLNLEENETVQEEEKLRKVVGSEAVTAGEPEKVRLPLQKLESAVNTAASKEGGADEIMLALESHLGAVSRVYGARSLFRQDDITSALSANSITGRSAGAKSKMLLFNGLYYRGSWATPFYQLRDGSDEFFFMTNEDAMKAPMMHARGQFLVADLPQLKARVLSLPYETSRYALCILLPDETEGLHDVIAQMQPSDFQLGREKAQLRQMHVSLPKFQVEETSRSESMLKQMGLRRLFSRTEAQLGLLSEDPDVHVDEIVQFVNVRVDEGGSSANALSAATQARSPQAAEDSASVLPVPEPEPEPGVERFEVNRPFAYFIIDCEEQFILASGKVYTPEFKDDLPGVSVEIELEQS